MTTQIIYILNANDEPLMPTHRLGKVRRWLNHGEAHWYGNSRTTIQFDRPVGKNTQNCIEGVDLGNHIGISVVCTTTNQELYSGISQRDYRGEVKRNVKRREYRHTRRNRLRHRKARVSNRKKPRTYNSKRLERGYKKAKGRRSIRHQHYPFQPHDKILCQEKVVECIGTMSNGKSVLFKWSTPKKLQLLYHSNNLIETVIRR